MSMYFWRYELELQVTRNTNNPGDQQHPMAFLERIILFTSFLKIRRVKTHSFIHQSGI